MNKTDLPFAVGTVVALKSGGPYMTFESYKVHDVYQDKKTAKCVYIYEGKKIEDYFDPLLLETVVIIT